MIGEITNEVILRYSGFLTRMTEKVAMLNDKVECVMVVKSGRMVLAAAVQVLTGTKLAGITASTPPVIPKLAEKRSVVLESRNKAD